MLNKSDVWSNSFFLAPLLVAVWAGLYLYAGLVASVMLVSTIYHSAPKGNVKIVDKILAYSLIISNLYIAYLGNFKFPYFLIAMVFVFIGLYFLVIKRRDNYEWHFSSAVITLFCLLTYMASI